MRAVSTRRGVNANAVAARVLQLYSSTSVPSSRAAKGWHINFKFHISPFSALPGLKTGPCNSIPLWRGRYTWAAPAQETPGREGTAVHVIYLATKWVVRLESTS